MAILNTNDLTGGRCTGRFEGALARLILKLFIRPESAHAFCVERHTFHFPSAGLQPRVVHVAQTGNFIARPLGENEGP